MSSSGQQPFSGEDEDGWNNEGQGSSSSKDKMKSDGGSDKGAKTGKTQRPSVHVTNALRVLREGMGRLTMERTQLESVLKNIGLAERDLDKEIERVKRMKEINQRAYDFQMGKSTAGVFLTTDAVEAPSAREGEPMPGTSTGSSGASLANNLKAITENILFDLGLEDQGASSGADSGAAGYLNQIMEGLGIPADTFPEDLLEDVMENLKKGSSDEKKKEDE